MSVYQYIIQKKSAGQKMLALLLDPDRCDVFGVSRLEKMLLHCHPGLIFVGGSLVSADTSAFVSMVKSVTTVPVVLFPGNVSQFSDSADALLFISLLSGRNPEFIIGQHVVAAPLIKHSGMETISTGYLLIDGNNVTSVQYMSNTMPIPSNKIDIAVATAMAAEMLGMKMVYLEAGSGAQCPVPAPLIEAVRHELTVPLIVGGGLNSPEKIESACRAGADIIVIGNALEKNLERMVEYNNIVSSFSAQ